MKEVKVSELQGAALDWAVAQVEGVKTIMLSPRKGDPKKPFALFGSLAFSVGGEDETSYAPSTCWHCGGPLIDSHRLYVEPALGGWHSMLKRENRIWCSGIPAKTPLIAACRAIVAAKLGDIVSIPDELME